MPGDTPDPTPAATGAPARDRLRAQDWNTLRVKLKTWAWHATGKRSWEHAEDLAGDAIALAFNPAGVQWNPEKEPVFRYLTGLVRGLLSNERRKMANTHERLTAKGSMAAFADDEARSPEAVAMRRVRVERLFERLAASAAKDPKRLALAKCFAEGLETAEEQAEATGMTVAEVVLARRRLYAAAEAIERERAETELSA
jgi:hypothetical protein